MSALLDLFHKHVAASFDKQLNFAEVIAGNDQKHQVDVQGGKIHFSCTRKGSGLFGKMTKVEQSYELQVLGSEASGLNTWLWIWANQGVNYPESVKQASLKMRQFGEREGIPEFTQGEFSCESLSGENLAMIASGVLDALSYVPLPYGGGCAYMLLYGDKKPHAVSNPLPRILTVFPQVLSAMSIPNHKQAMMGYLDFYSVPFTDRGSVLDARHDCGNIEAKFDEMNRLVDLSAKMGAPAKR